MSNVKYLGDSSVVVENRLLIVIYPESVFG
jgi:hypothetical protein